MKGYVTTKRGRYYAVIYEGLDPVTGRVRRSWHPAGTDREAAEPLARRLAAERQGRHDEVRALTFGAYLTGQWLPGKKLVLATSTYRGYQHVLPGMQGDAARIYQELTAPTVLPATSDPVERRENRRRKTA